MGQYLPIVVLLILGVLFAAGSFFASGLLAPRNSSKAKSAPYESGIVPGKGPPERFPVRFYLIAMIFIIFDIEIIFLYPWAVIHREIGLFGLVAIAIFAASVFESFLYLISKGALDWGPVARVAKARKTSQVSAKDAEAMVSSGRTARNTVRRVGTEGRITAPSSSEGAATRDHVDAGAH